MHGEFRGGGHVHKRRTIWEVEGGGGQEEKIKKANRGDEYYQNSSCAYT
jgi:hypothetical protein